MDIRRYLKRSPQKTPSESTESPSLKRKALISSDEEDVPETPKEKIKEKTKKRRVVEEETSKAVDKKKPNLSKLKPVNTADMFGGEIKRVERKKAPPKKESDLFDNDDEFDNSIMDIDESILEGGAEKDKPNHTNGKKAEKYKETSPRKKTPVKQNASKSSEKAKKHKIETTKDKSKLSTGIETENTLRSSPRRKTPLKMNGDNNTESSKSRSLTKKKVDKSSEEAKCSPRKDNLSKDSVESEVKTPVTKRKNLTKEFNDSDSPSSAKTPKSGRKGKAKDLDSSVLSDEERFERKRMSAMMFHKIKNRTTDALNAGCKEVPTGSPNCLAGSTFLVSGLLQSISRDEAKQIIEDLGGKVSTTVGKRLTYLVIGEEAGLKKIATAEELGIKQLSEDDFYDLIREKSGKKVTNKNANNNKSPLKKEKHKIKDEPVSPAPEKKKKINTPTKIKVEKIKIETITSPKPKATDEFVAKAPVDESMLPWVEKYKPLNLSQIIGQQGPASNSHKLLNWLKNWYVNHDGKKKLQKPNPWAKNDDGSFYKAALLSGPPGIGKTTTATLVCKELGFDTVEFNASDTRSKKLLQAEVSELLSNKSLYGYFHGKSQAVSKKHVLLMDEVDGMAGNEDRGGIQELISLIKNASVPIICMCNDRNHQKMRSLVNYCYDLKFSKPQLKQIKGAVSSICFKEKIKLPAGKIEEIIAATNNDIRQTLNHLSLLSAGKELNLEKDSKSSDENDNVAKKDLKLGPWEVVRKVFSIDEHKNMSLYDKCDLFFNDYSLGPLFVQQNYLQVSPAVSKSEVPSRVAMTADALSLGDLVEKRIRANSAWSLLPTQAVFSSVMPGEFMAGNFTGQINFPGWLGKNSKSSKRSRFAQEIHNHTRMVTSGSRLSIRMDYAPFLLNAIVRPLKSKGADGVDDALAVIKEYRLLREDIDSLIELATWPGKKSVWDSVDGKVKAALTRAYNKEVLAYTYSVASGIKKKAAAAESSEYPDLDEDGPADLTDDEENDKLENDTLIKAKKRPAVKATKTTDSKKPSTSKAKTGGSKPKK